MTTIKDETETAAPTRASQPVRRSPVRSFRPLGTPRRRLLVEALAVAGTLIVLEMIVFNDYFRGATSPTWDFANHYNTEAYAWWHDGSFFNPPDWLPYLWGGYPSTLNLQNSSFYLPVGLASILAPFTLHASAILSALHVAFGALGAYVFARSFRMRPSAAMVGLVIWFFAAGFYANASHLDIMRAYAWVPWVLMCASPSWPWRRWWGPVLATLVFWNAILAVYPGILIAGVYVGLVWIIIFQVTTKARLTHYLLPLACSLALAGAATLLRFLPFYLTRGVSGTSGPDGSIFTLQLLSTSFYRYVGANLPNDVTMRSFFLPVVAFAALAFVRFTRPVVWGGIGVAVVAVALGTPGTPWADKAPGLSVSRFTMSDFKVFFLFALCIVAMSAVDAIVSERRLVGAAGANVISRAAVPSGPRLIVLAGLVAGAASLGVNNTQAAGEWITPWLLLLIAVALLLLAARPLTAGQLRLIVLILALTATTSGHHWAMSNTETWSVDRLEATEYPYFGSPVSALIDSRAAQTSTTQRPGRLPDRGTYLDHSTDPYGNRSFYDGMLRLSGYTNLRGTPTFEKLRATLIDPGAADASRAFWLAQGMVVATADGALPTIEKSNACAAGDSCGLELSEPVSYSPSGQFVYRLAATQPTEVSLNEAYYPGWTVTACSSPGVCTALEATSGAGGQIVLDVPEGESTLTLTYSLPGSTASWAAFWGAVAALMLWAGVLGAWEARRSRGGMHRATGDDGSENDSGSPTTLMPLLVHARHAQVVTTQPYESDKA